MWINEFQSRDLRGVYVATQGARVEPCGVQVGDVMYRRGRDKSFGYFWLLNYCVVNPR